jgi:FemAB-related protein (PEP-CTERM system-associated)
MNAPVPRPEQSVRFAQLEDSAETARIDAFVSSHSNGTPFHRPAWQAAVAKACGHSCHYLVVEDSRGDLAGVLPLTEIRSRLFGKALVSSGFAVDGGILAESPMVEQALAAKAVTLARALAIPSVELRGGPAPKGWTVDEGTYAGFSRPLAKDDDAELQAIPRKQRAEVRKALGFDLAITVGTSAADRDAHYSVYATSVRNLGTPVFPRALFEATLDAFGDAADILTVHRHGQPLASVLSLYHAGVVMPYWGGGTADARTWRANDLMYYALMLHARAEKKCTTFDFGRSKVGTGPASFKKNWGFEAAPLSYAKWVADGAAPREINPMSPKYRFQVAAWKKLPLWLANGLGPLIARGLG